MLEERGDECVSCAHIPVVTVRRDSESKGWMGIKITMSLLFGGKGGRRLGESPRRYGYTATSKEEWLSKVLLLREVDMVGGGTWNKGSMKGQTQLL